MAPNPRVRAAFQAMKNLGIPENKTKPALKNLLKLFNKNWDLIEEENYRVLADAIFEYEETEAAENEKKKNTPVDTDQGAVLEEEAQIPEEPERPLKRLRLKHQGQAVTSHGQPSPTSGVCLLKKPKPEPDEPEAFPSERVQHMTGSPQFNAGNRRTESQPVSPQHLLRSKGKQPVSPHNGGVTRERPQPPAPVQISQRDQRAARGRASQGLQLKEPKLEPGVDTAKQKQPGPIALIKPKDEPFTDDMPSFEPLAVVLPVRSHQEAPSSFSNPVDQQDGQGPAASTPGASKSMDGNDKGAEMLASVREEESRLQEADVPERPPAKIDIAASSLGEVKISLSCNPGLKGHDFHVPDIPAVLKKMEDNCRKTYKVMDPEFSITKLMREFCECVVELGTKADGVAQERCRPQDTTVGDNKGTCGMSSSLNGSINAETSGNVAATTEIPDSNRTSASNDRTSAERNSGSVADTNMKNLVLVPLQQQLNHDNIRCLYDMSDLTGGEEEIKVSVEQSNESLPYFRYITQNVVSHNADVGFSLAQIGDQDCCLSCHGDCLSFSPPCNCAQRNGGESPYTSNGLVREDFLEECMSMAQNPQRHYLTYCKECPLERSKNEDMLDPCKGHLKRKFINECWTKCGCSKYCGNRVIQRGLRCNLQVFWTSEGKGWGLRTLEDLPKGAFVCEYVGEILTNTELRKRNLRRRNDKHSYSVLLDADWGLRTLKEEILFLDATFYGNVARFINHRCSDANLIEIPVELEAPNHHYYHVALFTTRKVDALEELTWDYGVDFDDNEHYIKAFRCLCNSKFCRNMKRSSRSRSALTLR